MARAGAGGTALVTGAGRGIGRAVARRLARGGWVVLGGVRTDEAGESLAADGITPLRLDVTSEEDVARLPDVLPQRLDALVNNVGVAVAGPVETLSPADMRHQFDVNLVGPLAVTKAALPALRTARGRIVFISSVNGLVSFPFTGLYNASKFAVEGVADCLRVELRPFGVDVVLVEPGVVDTDPWHEMDELIDRIEAGLEEPVRDLYAQHFVGERGLVDRIRKGAAPPDAVARAVERALVRRRAPVRVRVGRDARVLVVMRDLLPARALDAVWVRGLGLHRTAPRAAGAPPRQRSGGSASGSGARV